MQSKSGVCALAIFVFHRLRTESYARNIALFLGKSITRVQESEYIWNHMQDIENITKTRFKETLIGS